MNIIYIIFALLICLFLLSFWCIDHFYMKKIVNTYGFNSDNFNAFKKGAYMGMAKAIIMMGAFFSIAFTVAMYNNVHYQSEEIIKNYLNYPYLNNKNLNIDNDYIIRNNDTLYIDSLEKNTYIFHK